MCSFVFINRPRERFESITQFEGSSMILIFIRLPIEIFDANFIEDRRGAVYGVSSVVVVFFMMDRLVLDCREVLPSRAAEHGVDTTCLRFIIEGFLGDMSSKNGEEASQKGQLSVLSCL